MKHSHCPLALALVVSVVTRSPSFAQQFNYLQGGELNGIAVHVDGMSSQRGITAEDGGRVRFLRLGTWVQATTPDSYRSNLRGAFILDDDNYFVAGDGGQVLHSDDGGENWTTLNSSPITSLVSSSAGFPDPSGVQPEAELFDIVMLNELDGWAVGNDAAIAYTSNGGLTWTDLLDPAFTNGPFGYEPDPGDIYAIEYLPPVPAQGGNPAEEGVLIVPGDYNTVFRGVIDSLGNVTWGKALVNQLGSTGVYCADEFNAPNGDGFELWDVDFAGDEGWITGGVGTNTGIIIYSSDRGATWDQVQYVEPKSIFLADTQSSRSTPTTYGIAALGNGSAFSVAYASYTYSYESAGVAGPSQILDLCSCTRVCTPLTSVSSPTMVQIGPATDQALAPPLTAAAAPTPSTSRASRSVTRASDACGATSSETTSA